MRRRGRMFQVPLGIFKNPAMPYMRVGSYLPITVVLALVFVIPHGGLREGVIRGWLRLLDRQLREHLLLSV